MDSDAFKKIDPLLDKLAEYADKQLDSEELRHLLAEFAKFINDGQMASINITVDVFDEKRECSLRLLTTGLSAVSEEQPFRTWGDSTLQRYIVEDGIKVVPHDHCPQCWQMWDFKMQNATCPNCGIVLGDKCKLLLDSDECPWCNEGKVTIENPRCDKCDCEVDRQKAVWG